MPRRRPLGPCRPWDRNKVRRERSWLRRDEKRKWRYSKDYGITPDQAREILKFQGDKCAICSSPIAFGGKSDGSAHVDHNHITDEVRGILCHNCNRGLGNFKDDINKLLMAISYLNRKELALICKAI